MRITLKILLLVLAVTSGPALAAQNGNRWYQVELIVFAQRVDSSAGEVWPEHPSLPDISQARALLPARSTGNGDAFRMLTSNEFQLTDIERRLRASSRYTPLLHVAWRQPGLPQNRAVPVHLYLGKHGETRPSRSSYANPESARIDGTVRLVLSRYLHLQADLAYTDPAEDGQQQENDQDFSDLTAPQQHIYILNESRRMRSNEIHYLDHPKFGIIAKVSPYKGG